MANDPDSPATKEDIEWLSYQLEYTEIAIGCILSSFSKRVDLDSVFNEAFETAREVSKTASHDEGAFYVGNIIETIKGYAHLARSAPILPELPEEHRGYDVNGIPNDPSHTWNKKPTT